MTIDQQILRAIADYYVEQGQSWPSPLEIVEQVGHPIHGLVSILDRLMSQGKLCYECVGSSRRVALLLPPEHFDFCENYDNVTALGRWLCDELHFDGPSLQGYYEKPWKYRDQYAVYLAHTQLEAVR
jgi:hypothetical protein